MIISRYGRIKLPSKSINSSGSSSSGGSSSGSGSSGGSSSNGIYINSTSFLFMYEMRLHLVYFWTYFAYNLN